MSIGSRSFEIFMVLPGHAKYVYTSHCTSFAIFELCLMVPRTHDVFVVVPEIRILFDGNKAHFYLEKLFVLLDVMEVDNTALNCK